MNPREMVRWLRRVRDRLATEGWREIKERVEKIHLLNSKFFSESGSLPPTTIFLLVFCPKEERTDWWAFLVRDLPEEEVLRKEFPAFWGRVAAKALEEPCSCGCARLPLGYVLCAPAEERRTKEDLFCVMVNTVFGKKALASARVLPDRKLGELEWVEGEEIAGRMVIPLPQLEDLEKALEREAEADERMYW
jgi:hypothetical protein